MATAFMFVAFFYLTFYLISGNIIQDFVLYILLISRQADDRSNFY